LRCKVIEHPVEVAGFRFGWASAGIKPSRRPDCGLIVTEQPAAAGAVFTTNRFAAAPVELGRERVGKGRLQALFINSGNANACTGAVGVRDAARTSRMVAAELGIAPGLVAPLSTGVIGVPLPMGRIERGVRESARSARAGGIWKFARAIRTTDAFSKVAAQRIRLGGETVTVAGVAKGAGMISPDMATLLVFVLTDARLSSARARWLAREVAAGSFNQLTVDGDTSTNDSLYVLASGCRGPALGRSGQDLSRLRDAAVAIGERLARWVALDGEGATRAVRIEVTGAATMADARRVADAVGGSTLVKAALHGSDPNWGRIACAVGYSGARFEPGRVTIAVEDVVVFRRGVGVAGARTKARRRMAAEEFSIRIGLGAGRGMARVITSDLSPAYVRFNSAYTT
jgi:glutamate N-acetyltransferase/amino-acid N-acetyltransferase